MRLRTYYIVLALLLMIAGCKKDEAAPRVQFTSHTDMEKVWNSETLIVEAIDNEVVVKVEFLVGGSVLASLEAPPWEFELDTRSYQDGQLTVSAVAYDAEGNVSEEASLVLLIENVLFTVSIEEDYLYEDDEGIIDAKYVYYLTSSDGTPLGSAIVGNGDSWECKRPEGFNDEEFDFGIGYFKKSNSDPLYFTGWLMTFMDMKPGSNLYEISNGSSSSRGDYLGSCSFSSADIEEDAPYTLSSSGSSPWGSIYDDSASLSLYENSDQAYFYCKQGTNGYYKFYQDLLPDNHYLIRSADLNSNMMPYFIGFDYLAYSSLSVSVSAYPTPGDYNSGERNLIFSDRIYPSDEQDISFHYPVGHNAVKDFMVSASVYVNDYISHYITQAGPLPADLPEVDADIQSVWLDLPTKTEATITGSADIQWGDIFIREDNNWIALMNHGPVGEAVRIPGIPAEIHAAYNIPVISNSVISYYSHYLTDHGDVDGYDGYARHWARMKYIEPFYSSGTVHKEVGYFEYFDTYKSSSRDIHPRMHPEMHGPDPSEKWDR